LVLLPSWNWTKLRNMNLTDMRTSTAEERMYDLTNWIRLISVVKQALASQRLKNYTKFCRFSSVFYIQLCMFLYSTKMHKGDFHGLKNKIFIFILNATSWKNDTKLSKKVQQYDNPNNINNMQVGTICVE